MEDFIKKLSFIELEKTDSGYEFETDDYDVFTNVYNRLERINTITKNSPQSFLNESECSVEFDGDNFVVFLTGDFNIDEYKLEIKEG